MFNKILIANRGEIAVRIIRACKEMDIKTVAIYSKADKDALHVKLADEKICIGEAKPNQSYLNAQNIISATILTGAEAIHPGFGFLSENSKFANMCRECNINFIGPSPEAIEAMGNKAKAREIASAAKVPVIPGSKGKVNNVDEALKIADYIGFPVMIKASAGGGGRGMRLVYNKKDFIKSFETASAEAKAAFGDDSMYIEKYIENPRHVEIQILGDKYGNIIYLGERDCSIQRRHQKIIEEAPSPIITDRMRRKMGQAAVNLAKNVNYVGAGTVEFLVDKNLDFYFIEMNTRIQVEHPVTEMVTGIDIVKEQIKIAAGEKLSITQNDIEIKGHSIECRINAEDPDLDFRPSPGKINNVYLPGGNGVRIDSAIYPGYTIPPFYDSMIAKLIVHGKDREEAIQKMKRALSEFYIDGPKNNIELLKNIMDNKKFREGKVDTNFIASEYQLTSFKNVK